MKYQGMVSVLLFGLVGVASAQKDRLVVESKYAWPRERQIVLDGEWQLASGNTSQPATELPDLKSLEWFDTAVPTDVHWALYRANKAPHPYVGLNAKQLRWVEIW